MTLWFLGEVHEDLLELVSHAVVNITQHFGPFDIELGGLGAFQKKNRKILWAGISNGEYHIQNLYDAMAKEFKLLGIHPDPKGLNPHITLGRQLALLDSVSDLRDRYPVKPVKVRVNHLTVFESKRISGTLTYLPIARIELNK
jgi:2'-5' RNA ligase